jgi:hypothetical protein
MSTKTEAGPVAQDWLKARIDEEMAEYSAGAYADHGGARDQLALFAADLMLAAHPPAQEQQSAISPKDCVWARNGHQVCPSAAPAQEHPNLACKSVQKRLATQWGYVPAQEQPAPAVPSAAVLLAEQVLHMELATERGKRARELARQVLDTAHDVHEGECAAVLRNLASYLGAGGYNAAAVDPQVFREKIMWGIEEVRRATHPTPAAQEQPAPYFNRQAVERAISSAENPAPGTMQLNDGKERVTLPGGTLRRMLAIIDQLGATHPTPAEREEPGCRSPAQDLMLCPNSACGWMGRCLAAEPFQPAERAEQPQAEQELRELLAVRVAGALLYADDGELQDASELPAIDFKRDAPGEIARKLTDRGLKRLTRAEQPPRDAVQQGLPDEQIDALWRQAASADGFTTAQFVREFARAIERATLKGQP